MNNTNFEERNKIELRIVSILSGDNLERWKALQRTGMTNAAILRLLLEEGTHSPKIAHMLAAGGYQLNKEETQK